MTEKGQAGRLLYAVGVGLFGVALAAGVVESVRFNGRMPAIDLLMHGSDAYIHLLIHRKDFVQAIDQLEMQGRMVPPDAEARCLLGSVYMHTNEPELAADCFGEATRLDPRSFKAFAGLGLASGQLGKLAEAEKCFARAAELAPNDEARAYCNKALEQLRASPDKPKNGERD